MTITITTSGRKLNADINPGGSLLDAINKAGVTGFDAPCGGKGTCGKCKIELVLHCSGYVSAPDDVELKHLTEAEIESGIRLACRVFPSSDVEVKVPDDGGTAVIQSAFSGDFLERLNGDNPALRKNSIKLEHPSIDDQRSDLARLSDTLESMGIISDPDLNLIRKLPTILRENNFEITAVSLFGRLVGIEGGDTSARSFAVAVDIGTTTVVAYLVDLIGSRRGEVLDFVSGLNEQKGRGGDVISRIEYCMQKPENLDELGGRIRAQLEKMIDRLVKRNNLEIECIGLVTVAGNTTMTHIFSGFNPEGIASAPFIPVDTGMCSGAASSFGLGGGELCHCLVLPGISAYVGGDIASGIIASSMHKSEDLSLLIDIGTNGEIVLGNKNGLTACSTAAGPALEGANISCGMGGIAGAVNSIIVSEQDEHEVFELSVIGGGNPTGICGSGIIDALAVFITAGVIDETGRMLSEAELTEAGISRGWIECLSESEGMPALKIANGILLTQKDVREIQMAKAAIAAGINTLLSDTGRSTADVKKVFVAGGFGAAMNSKNAAVVGLFPAELEPVVEIAGNTAGKGAILSALSETILDEMREVAKKVDYVELSSSVKFQTEYMLQMYFYR
jgi:uncharacterized 2Fe-2S/4Fe-4S cluster protein (DUF4445 family)